MIERGSSISKKGTEFIGFGDNAGSARIKNCDWKKKTKKRIETLLKKMSEVFTETNLKKLCP